MKALERAEQIWGVANLIEGDGDTDGPAPIGFAITSVEPGGVFQLLCGPPTSDLGSPQEQARRFYDRCREQVEDGDYMEDLRKRLVERAQEVGESFMFQGDDDAS